MSSGGDTGEPGGHGRALDLFTFGVKQINGKKGQREILTLLTDKLYDLDVLEELVTRHKDSIEQSKSWTDWIKRSLIMLLLSVITVCIMLLIISKLFNKP